MSVLKANKSPKKRKAIEELTVPEITPHCFLQCHDGGTDSDNFSQQVWCCKFQPGSCDIVATCGGECVCIIDANSAKVKSRFLKQGEEFYTLDWAVMETGDFSSNVLACGGCLGFIYLIHAEQFLVYGFFKAHNKPVQTMNFMPGKPNLLISAGNDKKIYLWDVGMLSLPDYSFSYRKLAVFENLEFSPLKMVVFKTNTLLCASEGGLFYWDATGLFSSETEKWKHTKFPRLYDIVEIKFPFLEDEPLVDGLALINEDLIATKSAEAGVIFLWKPSDTLPKRKEKSNCIVASVIQELKWSNTTQFYINITSCIQHHILLAGDEKGDVWVYDCKSVNSNGYVPGEVKRESLIVKWPDCTRNGKIAIESLDKGTVMNDICCSDNLDFIVVASDNNLVCIYKVQK